MHFRLGKGPSVLYLLSAGDHVSKQFLIALVAVHTSSQIFPGKQTSTSALWMGKTLPDSFGLQHWTTHLSPRPHETENFYTGKRKKS